MSMLLVSTPHSHQTLSSLDSMYPSYVQFLSESMGQNLSLCVAETDTVYGVCTHGRGVLQGTKDRKIFFSEGSAFCLTGGFEACPVGDTGFEIYVIVRVGYRAISGSTFLERKGRLTYIDGCSDTLLFGPHRQGDPCLNLLHFPKNIDQTMHSHPDIRIGVVISGNGLATTLDGDIPLTKGSMFILSEGTPHRFRTENEEMRVVAYHPTTDTGPTDAAHPMRSRTYLGNTR